MYHSTVRPLDKMLDGSFGVKAQAEYYCDFTEDEPDVRLDQVLPVDDLESEEVPIVVAGLKRKRVMEEGYAIKRAKRAAEDT